MSKSARAGIIRTLFHHFLNKTIIIALVTRVCLLTSRSASAFVNSKKSTFHKELARKTFFAVPSTTGSMSSATTTTTSSNNNSNNSNNIDLVKPPVARRDENGVVWAGIAPEGWDMTKVPRQAESSTEKLLDPPVAVPDPYGWIRDEKRENQQVLDHLNAENAYTQAMTKHLQDSSEGAEDGIVTALYKEMLAVIQETDYTTPRPDKDYLYYTRTIKGKSYTVHCRAPKAAIDILWKEEMSEEEKAITPVLMGEQVILDVNQLAEGKSYCSTGSVKKSPSQKLLAYAVDFTGDEKCLLFVKDLACGNVVHEDPNLEIYGSLQWGIDDRTLFYLKQDAAQRPYQVYRRTLNNDNEASDELLFEELDDLNWVGCYKSKDSRYLFVETSSKETTEIHYLDLQDPTATFQCIAPRRSKVLYEVEHRNGQWWISSNVGGLPNMALFTAPAVTNSQDQWRLVTDSAGTPLFDGGYARSLDHVSCFAQHVVASGREGGLPRVWIVGLLENESVQRDAAVVNKFEMLTFAEEACDVGMGTNHEYHAATIVVTYDSMVTPTQSIEIDLNNTSQRTVLKERAVPGYQKELYSCERLTVTSRDGETEIPVSMVYRIDTMDQHASEDGHPVPVHLYGYGSYGNCMEADFVSTRLPLLNRGMVYVIAHVRGGGEMGRTWYEEPNGGKYLCKTNTFNDFVDIAKWLIDDRKLTTPELLSCEGRSAGGLLIGASINQAPELFKVAVLGVPFVDVVPTMIDASIPLTAVEWEEWGNPNEEKYHQYMMSYNPITNVKNAKYPACFLTGGLHDPRVQVSMTYCSILSLWWSCGG